MHIYSGDFKTKDFKHQEPENRFSPCFLFLLLDRPRCWVSWAAGVIVRNTWIKPPSGHQRRSICFPVKPEKLVIQLLTSSTHWSHHLVCETASLPGSGCWASLCLCPSNARTKGGSRERAWDLLPLPWGDLHDSIVSKDTRSVKSPLFPLSKFLQPLLSVNKKNVVHTFSKCAA